MMTIVTVIGGLALLILANNMLTNVTHVYVSVTLQHAKLQVWTSKEYRSWGLVWSRGLEMTPHGWRHLWHKPRWVKV